MDAAAVYAGTVLLRKTFEVVAHRSLSSIFSTLNSRFRGHPNQLQTLQRELESRLQVLSLPVDMCVQYVLHGNTSLQSALDMVLLVINDIIKFQEELEAQSYNENIPKVSQAEAAKRLEGFLTRLDKILPYLALAVNAVSILQRTDPGLSPSRLMEASHMIRNASSRNGMAMNILAKFHKFETRLTLPRWQEKMLSSHVALRLCQGNAANPAVAFELVVENEDSDSADVEKPLVIPIGDIAAVGSSTVHALGLGEHDLEGVLLIDVIPNSVKQKSYNSGESLPSTPLKERQLQTDLFSPKFDSLDNVTHYALQCIDEDYESSQEDFESKCTDDEGKEAEGSEGDAEEAFREPFSGSMTRIAKLGVLECALRLCMLQAREEKEHWLVPDERIKMFFADPRHISLPIANAQRSQSGGRNDSGKVTPRQTKASRVQMQMASSSQQSTSRISITDIFYDLKIDSPNSGKQGGQ